MNEGIDKRLKKKKKKKRKGKKEKGKLEGDGRRRRKSFLPFFLHHRAYREEKKVTENILRKR